MVLEAGATGAGEGGAAGGGTGAETSGGAASGDGGTATGGTKEASGGDTGKGGAAAGGGQATGDVKSYTPNFKYRVLKEEKEIPDWARSIVKDQATEKQVRELFEKSDGLSAVTTHRDQLIQENKQMREQWGPFVQDAMAALNAAKAGDLDTFFEKVGLNELAILKYAQHRLQLREKPDLLAAHNRDRETARQLAELKEQNERLSASFAETSVQARSRDLDMQLARPETLTAAQAFDARRGAGAFRTEVIARGQFHASQGRDISAEQAVNEVLQLIGWSGQTAIPPTVSPAAGGASSGGTQESKPTLPVIRGKGTAPVKKVPRSTEELRQLAREKMGLGAS